MMKLINISKEEHETRIKDLEDFKKELASLGEKLDAKQKENILKQLRDEKGE